MGCFLDLLAQYQQACGVRCDQNISLFLDSGCGSRWQKSGQKKKKTNSDWKNLDGHSAFSNSSIWNLKNTAENSSTNIFTSVPVGFQVFVVRGLRAGDMYTTINCFSEHQLLIRIMEPQAMPIQYSLNGTLIWTCARPTGHLHKNCGQLPQATVIYIRTLARNWQTELSRKSSASKYVH